MRRARRLLAYLGPYRWLVAASVAAAVAASALEGLMFALLIPLLQLLFDTGPVLGAGSMVERAVGWLAGGWLAPSDPAGALRAVIVLMLGAVALKNVGAVAAAYTAGVAHEGVVRDIRRQLFAHLQRFGLGFYRRRRTGQILSRVFADVDQLAEFHHHLLHTVARLGLVIVIYVAMLFALSWSLTVITLVAAPLIALALTPVLRRLRVASRVAATERGTMTALVDEAIRGAREVKAHGAEAFERERFASATDTFRRHRLHSHRFHVLASPLSETLGAAVFVVLVAAGVWATAAGPRMAPELVVTYLAVALRLLSPVKRVAQFPAVSAHADASAERVFELLDRPADDVDEAGGSTFTALHEAIEFRDVWFAYETEQWVLRGVSLRVPRGSVVAIVGASGAGKSTLADLVPRFLDPHRGTVCLDGVPTTQYTRRSLRAAIGFVGQETVVFHDTVAANIAYGRPASREEIIAAARAANAHDFIRGLPRGYETVVGERGQGLSGGERQRIAVARVLLQDPAVLILDEATSALDAPSERAVQQAVTRLMADRTVLIIAHRLSTVEHADAIAVLDGGRIVEWGPHRELVTAGGPYQRLHAADLSSA